ncbi:CLUMA_CG017713, isoform A [Clunio marinus]|uniref:CLUMA_CG017713, isoform A n=1 Tax=Clunio marinus TaxID=568069 RepID=A0A1J1J1B8_9DIPT|nr:CLUMA_CG017713, isoform A [Clunio marinus]
MRKHLKFSLIVLLLSLSFLCLIYTKKFQINSSATFNNESFESIISISTSPLTFDSIETAYVQPENGRNVFFIDSLNLTTNVVIKARTACAVESAALINPSFEVFLIYSSKERLQNIENTPELQAILTYPNVHIYFINDITKFTIGTPFEDFVKSGKLLNSKHPTEHTSDVLRFVLLWKFGGTYLDTDTITRLPFDNLEPNFACRHDGDNLLCNGVMNMESADKSHLVTLFSEQLVNDFNGNIYTRNGPQLVTSVVQKLCGTKNATEIINKKECGGFHVLPPEMCYPIPYRDHRQLFNSSFSDEVMKKVDSSVTVHFWNKGTKGIKLERADKSAYIKLAEQYCPRIMSVDRRFF